MARVVIFSSGNGSNFQTITEHLLSHKSHKVVGMVCNRKSAYSFDRADNLKIPSYHIKYTGRSRDDVEVELVHFLKNQKVDLIVLAGYMKLLTPILINAFPNQIINIHPALLPKYPGCNGIGESFNSGDREAGVTIHYVDYGIDTGQIIKQVSFVRDKNDSFEDFEFKIHQLEYLHYPKVIVDLLDKIDKANE